MAEALYPIGSELHQAALGLLDGFLCGKTSLAEKLVGIAHQLLLDGFREEVLVGQWQLLLLYLLKRDACASVPLTHTGMLGEALLSEKLGSDASVQDIGLSTEAMNAWCVALEDTDVVEHGCLFHKAPVDFQFRVGINNP